MYILPDGSVPMAPDIVDLTAKSPQGYRVKYKERTKDRIDAVILHQTAFNRGNAPELYLKTHAHFVLLQNGTIVQLHPVSAWIVSSSAFNDNGIAIEVVGNFPNDRGVYWRGDEYGRHKLFWQQISGGRELVTYLTNMHDLKFIFAHRQGEDDRRENCPGPDIWYHIAETWALKTLGLSDGGPGYTEGAGLPIPDSWRKKR
jgi:hypothetical protein